MHPFEIHLEHYNSNQDAHFLLSQKTFSAQVTPAQLTELVRLLKKYNHLNDDTFTYLTQLDHSPLNKLELLALYNELGSRFCIKYLVHFAGNSERFLSYLYKNHSLFDGLTENNNLFRSIHLKNIVGKATELKRKNELDEAAFIEVCNINLTNMSLLELRQICHALGPLYANRFFDRTLAANPHLQQELTSCQSHAMWFLGLLDENHTIFDTLKDELHSMRASNKKLKNFDIARMCILRHCSRGNYPEIALRILPGWCLPPVFEPKEIALELKNDAFAFFQENPALLIKQFVEQQTAQNPKLNLFIVDINQLADFIQDQVSKRYQVIVHNTGHYTALDVINGASCLVLDAANDPRMSAVVDVCRTNGLKTLVAMCQDGEALQKDDFSCPLFAFDHCMQLAATSEGLHEKLFLKAQPYNGVFHLAWLHFPPNLVWNAEASTWLSQYEHITERTDPAFKEHMMPNGFTYQSYLADQINAPENQALFTRVLQAEAELFIKRTCPTPLTEALKQLGTFSIATAVDSMQPGHLTLTQQQGNSLV